MQLNYLNFDRCHKNAEEILIRRESDIKMQFTPYQGRDNCTNDLLKDSVGRKDTISIVEQDFIVKKTEIGFSIIC